MSILRDERFEFFYDYSVSGEISTQLNPGKSFALREVRIHLVLAGASGEFTVQKDSNEGVYYDDVVLSDELGGLNDYSYVWSNPPIFENGDKLNVTVPNPNSDNTIGFTAVWIPLGRN